MGDDPPAPPPPKDWTKILGDEPKSDVSSMLDEMRNAEGGQESGSNYNVHPNTRTGALGKFQVLPGNVPAWTKKHLGRAMTPQQFAADPSAQDKVFNGEMGEYLTKAQQLSDDPTIQKRMGAAAWYGGPGAMLKYDNPKRFRPNEPSFREYTQGVVNRTSAPTDTRDPFVDPNTPLRPDLVAPEPAIPLNGKVLHPRGKNAKVSVVPLSPEDTATVSAAQADRSRRLQGVRSGELPNAYPADTPDTPKDWTAILGGEPGTPAVAPASPVAAPTAPAQPQQPSRWQDAYAQPDWQSKLTKLNPQDEQNFQSWAKRNNAPITADYDMRGFWDALRNKDPRAGTAINPNDKQLHFPDTWKTPLHKSFSGESIYAKPGGPTWNEQDQLLDPSGKVLFDERAKTGQPPPVPEKPATLDAQFKSALDPQSPRAAVLVTPGERPRVIPQGFTPVDTPAGKLWVHDGKLNKLGITDPATYVEANGFDDLVGTVDPVGDTSKGVAITGTDKTGNEVESKIVTSPEAAKVQRQVIGKMHPGATTRMVTPNQVIRGRSNVNADDVNYWLGISPGDFAKMTPDGQKKALAVAANLHAVDLRRHADNIALQPKPTSDQQAGYRANAGFGASPGPVNPLSGQATPISRIANRAVINPANVMRPTKLPPLVSNRGVAQPDTGGSMLPSANRFNYQPPVRNEGASVQAAMIDRIDKMPRAEFDKLPASTKNEYNSVKVRQVQAQEAADEAVKNEIRSNLAQNISFYGMDDAQKEQTLRLITDKTLQLRQQEQAQNQEILSSLTPKEKEYLKNEVDYYTQQSRIESGVSSGGSGAVADTEMALAGVLRAVGAATGHDDIGGLRRSGVLRRESIRQALQQLPPSTLRDIASAVGAFPLTAARIALLSKLPGGAIAGFGTDALLQGVGAHDAPERVISNTLKNLAVGAAFHGAGNMRVIPRMAATAANTATAGAATLNQPNLPEAVTNALFAGGPGAISELRSDLRDATSRPVVPDSRITEPVKPTESTTVPRGTTDLPKVDDIAASIRENNVLGRGGNATVYSINDNYVARTPNGEKADLAGAVKPVEDILPGMDVGQTVARAGNVQILRRVAGEQAGVPFGPIRSAGGPEADRIYEQQTQAAAEMPQSAYDNLARTIVELNNRGYGFDPSKAGNILIDTAGRRFNVVDINPKHPTSPGSSVAHMIIPLMDNSFAYRYKGNSPEMQGWRGQIIDKAELAAKTAGMLPATANDSSYQYSLDLAGRKGGGEAESARGRAETATVKSPERRDYANITDYFEARRQWKAAQESAARPSSALVKPAPDAELESLLEPQAEPKASPVAPVTRADLGEVEQREPLTDVPEPPAKADAPFGDVPPPSESATKTPKEKVPPGIRRHGATMRAAGLAAPDVAYDPQTVQAWKADANNTIDELGVDKAIQQYKDLPDGDEGGKYSLGNELLNRLTPGTQEYSDVAQHQIIHAGEAGQTLRAAAEVSRRDPANMVKYTEMAMQKARKRGLTAAEVERVQKQADAQQKANEQAAPIDAALTELENRLRENRPNGTLSQAVRRAGGISADDINAGELAGLANKESGSTGLLTKNGRSVEEMANSMYQAGYLRDIPDILSDPENEYVDVDKFLQALHEDIGGTKEHRHVDELDNPEDDEAGWKRVELKEQERAEFDKRMTFMEDPEVQDLLQKLEKNPQDEQARAEMKVVGGEHGLTDDAIAKTISYVTEEGDTSWLAENAPGRLKTDVRAAPTAKPEGKSAGAFDIPLKDRDLEAYARYKESLDNPKGKAKGNRQRGNAPRKITYEVRLKDRAEAALAKLKGRKLDFGGELVKPGERGAVRFTVERGPLKGDLESVAEWVAGHLSRMENTDALAKNLSENFGKEIEPHIRNIRDRAYTIRAEARREAIKSTPERKETILAEIRKEITDANKAIDQYHKDAQKAEDEVRRQDKQDRVQTKYVADVKERAAMLAAKAKTRLDKTEQARQMRDYAKEARIRKFEAQDELRKARQTEQKGYRETIKTQKAADAKESRWDTATRRVADAARERLKIATDPKDKQTHSDLVAVAREAFLSDKGGPGIKAVGADPIYRMLSEFPRLKITKRQAHKIFTEAYESANDTVRAAREVTRMRSASKESAALWDKFWEGKPEGRDISAQALLIQKADSLRQQNELRQEQNREFERLTAGPIRKVINAVGGSQRGLRSSIDSPLGRQGLPGLLAHPLLTLKTVPASLRAYGMGPKAWENYQAEFQQRPGFTTARDAMGIKFDQTEEQFYQSLATRLPHVKRSEQGYSAQMNEQRLAIANKYATLGEMQGYTPENNPKFYKEIGRIINVMTGRGDLTEKQKAFSQFTQDFLFSPRLNISRLQMMKDALTLPFKWTKYDPVTRRIYARNILTTLGTLAITGALAKQAGLNVGLNPYSPDFLKLRKGDVRYDITGGNGAMVRACFILAMKAGGRDIVGTGLHKLGQVDTPLAPYIKAADREVWANNSGMREVGANLWQAAQYKLAPLATTSVQAAGIGKNVFKKLHADQSISPSDVVGEDAVGDPITIFPDASNPLTTARTNIFLQMVEPMVTSDFMDAYDDLGAIKGYNVDPLKLGEGTLLASPSLLGFGVQTYPDKDKSRKYAKRPH